MRFGRPIVAVAAMLLASGCASAPDQSVPAALPSTEPVLDPLEAMIPLPRDGDRAVYATESYRNFLEVSSAWEGSAPSDIVSTAMLERAYASLDAEPSWPPYREAIDPSSNRLMWSVDPCPFNRDGECKGPYHPGYESWRYDVDGLPWGYGSSIFQGRLLREGLVFNETFPLGLVPVTVRFEVVDALVVDNATQFDVVGNLPMSGNATEMIAGTWRLSSASPFALGYNTTLTLAGTKTNTFNVAINATLTEFLPGEGDPIVEPPTGWNPPMPGPSGALALEGGLPAGADADLGIDGYTFPGAWKHLLRQQPELSAAASDPTFRLWHMQVPREETSGGLVVHQHHVEGSFSYFHGERFDSAFVARDCSRVEPVRLEVSCDYSGAGPTDGTRGLRGEVSFHESINLREAHRIANESLPRPARIFTFGTDTNGAEDPSMRAESYSFSFYYEILDRDGAPSDRFGLVRIDALTGGVRSRTVENV